MKKLTQHLCLYLCFLSAALPAQAKKDTQKEPMPTREIVQGVIYDAETGKPLSGATVALRKRDGGVIAWGKTDAQGAYRLDGHYITEVKLPEYKKKNGSLLGQIAYGAGQVWGFAARSATALVKPVARAAGSAVGGPVAGAVVGEVADAVVPRQTTPPPELPNPNNPAVFQVKVVCPDYGDYIGPVQSYWMDPPDPAVNDRTLFFWLDHIGLAPRNGEKKLQSGPRGEAMRLHDALLEPSIAQRGSEVTIAVRLDIPEEAENCVRVLARHEKSGNMITLKPSHEQPGLFRGKMRVGDKWPTDDQQIVILALRSVPASPQGPRAATPEELADRLSLWRSRGIIFDPQVLASRDREKLTLTVVTN